jgi:hypothetical protein
MQQCWVIEGRNRFRYTQSIKLFLLSPEFLYTFFLFGSIAPYAVFLDRFSHIRSLHLQFQNSAQEGRTLHNYLL